MVRRYGVALGLSAKILTPLYAPFKICNARNYGAAVKCGAGAMLQDFNSHSPTPPYNFPCQFFHWVAPVPGSR